MTIPPNKSVIFIVGPTAVGKTSVAIAVAGHFNTVIISADSRQCFKEMNIGVARPSVAELAEVPHYFIASHSIRDNVTAATFEKYAMDQLEGLFRLHDTVVVTGGTGLYVKALCEGLDEIPDTDSAIRRSVRDRYQANGLEWLRAELAQKDPDFARQGEMQNPQRMMRALEVWESTGRSILSFRSGQTAERPFRIIKLGLELPKVSLHARINDRVDHMVKAGLVEEVRSLSPYRQVNALQTVGYREVFEYLDGQCTLEQTIENIKVATRQYAKRQMTWFKKDRDIHWFDPNQKGAILNWLDNLIAT